MKKFNSILAGLLWVAVLGFFAQCSSNSGNKSSQPVYIGSDSVGVHLPVAYIRSDSLLKNYRFANDMNDAMMKELEDQSANLNQKKQKHEREVEEFQRKVKLNAYLTQERMQQEYERLGRQDEELNRYAANIQNSLAQKSALVSQQLQDTILVQIKEFNTPKRYEMIFSNIGSDNFFFIDESYDITKEVIDYLNSRYEAAKK